MANFLSETKVQIIEALARLGWSLRRIQGETGTRRETAGRYVRAAGLAVRPPGRWGHGPPEAAIEVSTDSGPTILSPEAPPARAPRRQARSACEEHREFIETAVLRGRNAVSIWQDLVDIHGFAAGYASVKRFVRRLRARAPEGCGVIETAPGEEAQVDYADGPLVRDPVTGKYRRPYLFIMTLGWSRKCVRLLTWKTSAETWARLHEEAFRRLGGATATVVLDNLKEGVLSPDIYDPALNPLYRDVLAHYGAVAMPCRPRDPDRKGKVERAVQHTAGTRFKGRKFEGLEEAQADLDHWDARWADTRIHGTTKRQVAAMFEEERPSLAPLPVEPFRYYRHGVRTVHLDGCVEVDRAYYGTPPGFIGRRVAVRWDDHVVRIISAETGELLVEHVRTSAGRRRMRDEDRPANTPVGVARLLSRAEAVGEQVGVLCRAIHEREGAPGVRRVLGVLSLARRHGAAALETACRTALEMEMPTYRFVKHWIEKHPPIQLTLKQVDPLIRELTHYRDLIEARTADPDPNDPDRNDLDRKEATP